MWTQLHYWILDAERGFCLVETGLQLPAGNRSFPSSPAQSIEKLRLMSDFLGWGCGQKPWISRLHCTCRAICTSSWSWKSASGGDLACRYALSGGGQALGGHSKYREYVITHWILCECSVTRVHHRLPWCWHCGRFYVGCEPARVLFARRDMSSKFVLWTGTPKTDMSFEMM